MPNINYLLATTDNSNANANASKRANDNPNPLRTNTECLGDTATPTDDESDNAEEPEEPDASNDLDEFANSAWPLDPEDMDTLPPDMDTHNY